MNNLQTRVADCFSNVFPELDRADIIRARQESLVSWDSLSHVTLLSAIAEEFQFEMEDEFPEDLTSYDLIVTYVESRVGGS
jgi:acyl carrier protein